MAINEHRRRRWVIPLGILALLVLASAACVGQTGDISGFSLRESYNLKSGEQRDGDQLVIANQINLEPDSVITGDVTLLGNRVELGAQIEGDVVVIADQLRVADTTDIQGNLTLCVNTLKQDEAARITGTVKEECADSGRVSASNVVESGWRGWRQSALIRLGSAIGGALFAGIFAALSMFVLPAPMIRMSRSVRQAPVASGGIGCLTWVVAIGVTVAYAVSLLLVLPLLLLPLVIVGWLLLGLAVLLGWVALAEPFGRTVFRWLGIADQPPVIAAVIGGVLLTLLVRIWGVFWFTEWIGAVLSIVLGSVGLGAVILTRVGMRAYPPRAPESRTTENIPE